MAALVIIVRIVLGILLLFFYYFNRRMIILALDSEEPENVFDMGAFIISLAVIALIFFLLYKTF